MGQDVWRHDRAVAAARAERRRRTLVCRPEHGGDRNSERRGEVHGARIVRDKRRAAADRADEQTQIGPPDQIHDPDVGRQRGFYLTARIAIAAGAEEHTANAGLP